MAEKLFDFRSWIKDQSGDYLLKVVDNDRILLSTSYAEAQINFYAMDREPEIVEFHIVNKADGEDKFFLHFHADDKDHATGLFAEMVEVLVGLKDKQTSEFLLCCTAGITTSFFADRLNKVAKAMGLDWSFSAVSVNEVYEYGEDKAAILVAPQIGYMADRVGEIMRDVPVLRIPTAVFAAYDAAGCVEFVRDELRERSKSAEERALEHVAGDLPNDKRVFVVAVRLDADGARMLYRLYDGGEVKLCERAIKRTLTVRDLTDIIDTQVCPCSGRLHADVIGIALPGVMHDGTLDLPARSTHDLTNGEDDFVIEKYFNERYELPVVFCNNTNSAALGWYGSQDKYRNVVFYSQPRGWSMGGQGIVVDGRLAAGAHGIAGEIKYIVQQFSLSHPLSFNAYMPKDVLELVGKVLAMDAAVLDPEVVCLNCELLPDVDEVRRELSQYVPEECQPEIVRVDDYEEYILLGLMVLCLQRVANR